MKLENQLRLARMASANAIYGGASALYLAKRMHRITGSTEGEEIVGRVYAHPEGRATHECRECGQQYVDPVHAAACCAAIEDDFEMEQAEELAA
jgi:hypothetical protein